MGLRLNHFCLVFGIVLIVLALSVFAHASDAASDSPPVWSQNIPSLSEYWAYDLTNLLNLSRYVSDSNVDSLVFDVNSQSNPGLVDCFISSNKYLSCTKVAFSESSSVVTVTATDADGFFADANITISFTNVAPFWTNLVPTQCLNDSNTQIVDLRDYAYDAEDTNANLSFFIQDQSNTNGLGCSVADSHFLSCSLSTNRKISSDLNIGVADSEGAVSYETATIRTNCFDSNGNPVGDTQGKGSIYLASDTKNVCMEQCASASTQVTLTNNTNVRKCFDLAAEALPYNSLNVSVLPGQTCLNAGESTTVALTANSCGSEERPYTVRLYDTDSNAEIFFNYNVGSCTNTDAFSIVDFSGQVCRGDKQGITVLVRNPTSGKERLFLSADNAMMMPYFDRPFVDIDSGAQKAVQLMVNARALDVGDYRVSLDATSGDFHASKRLDVSVVDCSANPERTFSLNVPDICYDAVKGRTIESQFSILNQQNGGVSYFNTTKDFFLNIYGMPAQLSQSKVSLGPGEAKAITYTIAVPADAAAGHHFVTLEGSDGQEWNSFKEQKNICINVLGENKASIFVKTQAKDILWGGSAVFEIELSNNGDFDSNFGLSVAQAPRGISVQFPENQISIPAGGTKTVYAVISAGAGAEVKDNQSVKILVDGPVQLSAYIYFNVKERTALDDLEILSYTNQVKMNANETAGFDLVIKNTTDAVMKNVVVSVENLPSGVTSEPITVGDIAAGKTLNVSGTITAGDTNGTFQPAFVVSSQGAANKRPFELVIEKAQNGGLAGLFGLGLFGGNSLAQVIFASLVWAIVLIVLVAVVIYATRAFSRPKAEENWAEK